MKVFATKHFPGAALDELSDITVGSLDTADESVRESVEALMLGGEVVDEYVLDRWPKLRMIARVGVGYDAVDVGACRARGVIVTNTPGVLDQATADLTFALILAARRRVVEGDRLIRGGGWTGSWADSYLAGGVSGATLGIVGLGRIGRAVATRARAFSMSVLYTDLARDSVAEATFAVQWASLDDLLARSDIVTLHVPLTSDTRQLIGASQLSLMRDGSCLINASRGGVVDEHALVAELRTGRLLAGLDVFADEPHVPAELLALDNVVLSPHMGSATVSTRHAMTGLAVANVLAVAGGHAPLTPVDHGQDLVGDRSPGLVSAGKSGGTA
jgi:glyoxylate reductase